MGGFLQDDAGNSSSVRLRAFITLIVFLAVWSFVAITKKEIPAIPETVLIFVLSVCGISTVQKIWGESKSPTPPQNTPKE